MARSKWINKKQANRKVRPAAQNPSITKFRDQSKLNQTKSMKLSSAATSSKSMKLTADNLAIHDALMNESTPSNELIQQPQPPSNELIQQPPMDQDNKSTFSFSIGETEMNKLKGFTMGDQLSDAQTFATCFTNCTNASFGYFLRKFDSKSNVHKEMLSILAAVTDLINEQKDDDNDEKYFDLLIKSIYSCENTLTLTANIILLYYVIKRMKPDYLKDQFSSFQQLVSDLLKKYLNKSNVSFVKFLLKSYFIFLQEQDAQEWENSITQTNFANNLLILSVNPRSRIRKVAKDCVTKLFVKLDEQAIFEHPIYTLTTEFAKRKVKDTSGEDITDALYVLNIWKEIIHYLPIVNLTSVCEQLIGLLSLGNVLIFTNCMQILENLFKSNNCKHMNSDLNYKIIKALCNNQPSLNDNQPLLAWCSVMKYAELSLINLDKNLTDKHKHLLNLLGIYFSFLKSDDQIVRSFVGQCINELMSRTIELKDDFKSTTFNAIGEFLRSFLAFKYTFIWRLIFKLYSTFFKLTGTQFDDLIKRSFIDLLKLKDLNCEESIKLKYDYPIQSLIRYHGVEFVLEHIKLEPDFKTHTISNLWLIDILRQNVKNDKISNFIKYIFEPTRKICPDLNQFNINNNSPWLFVYVQLWSLLPVFLNEPTDIKTNFKSIARILGDGLTNGPPIRTFIMRALRQLINKNRNDDDLIEVSKYAKNYIPILLNLYVSDLSEDKAMKTSLYQTLSMFFAINDSTLNEKIYDKVLENKDAEQDQKKKSLYLDILRCIICNLTNVDKIVKAFELGFQLTQNKEDRLEQKKAFRLIEELIKIPNNYSLICDFYQRTNAKSFYDEMIDYYSANYSSISIFATQASFTRFIQCVINEQFKDQQFSLNDFNRLIPVLINILDSKKSSKLTSSVFGVLYCCIDLMNDGPNIGIKILIQQLDDRISLDRKATLIFILHNILLKYKQKIENRTKENLIDSLLKNLNNESSKVINIILVFLNDWFKLSTKDEMIPYVTKFIDYLNSIDNPCSIHFKYKIKNIIEKIIKKFGVELVSKRLDNKYQRLIKMMIKKENRSKKSTKTHKNKTRDDEFDDDEDVDEKDELDDDEKREFRKTKSNKRWKFDEDDDFDGFHIFDEDLSKDENESKDRSIKPSTSKVKQDQIIRLDKEGQIITDDTMVNESIKRKNDSDESSDDDDDKPSKKPHQQSKNKNIRDHILNKYRRKRGIHRDLNTNSTGAEYRSTRSHGDIKRDGLPDPYAYVSMDKSVLSKRRSLKNKIKFRNAVKVAMKGGRPSTKGVKKNRK